MNRNDMIKLLTLARPFLMKQDFIPILTHFCFDKEHIIGYNDVAGIRLSFASELHCALPGDLTIKLLNTMNDETIRFKFDGNQIIIHSGKSKLKLPTLPPEEFVFSIPEVTNSMDHIVLTPSVKKGLEKCLECVGTDPSHPEHTGIKWTIDAKNQAIYSTDNKTISKYQLLDIEFECNRINVITPAFFCFQLLALMDYFCDDNDTIKIYFNDEFAIAKIGLECTIFTKLISLKEDIDFERLISNLTEGVNFETVTEPPADLAPALERASLLIGSAISDISSVSLSNNELKILTESQYGNADDVITFDEEFDSAKFKVKPQLIQRGFKVASKIKITPNLIVMSSNDNQFLHLVAHSNTTL